MKNLLIILLLLLSFNFFGLENGEVIFDTSIYFQTTYLDITIKRIYYTVDEENNIYDFRIMFYEKLSDILYIKNAKLNLNILIKEGEKNINHESFKNGNFIIIIKEIYFEAYNKFEIYPIFIYSDKKNNYKKVKSFDGIKELET